MTDTQTPAAGIEPTISRGGSDPFSFEDMGEIESAPKPKAEPKEKDEPKAKSAPKRDAEDKTKSADTDGKKPKAATGKAGSADEDDAVDDKPQADKGEEKERKAKPKVHKARSGESVIDVAGDTVFTVPVAGKKEEVLLQDLLDDFSGKTDWSRKYSDFGKEKESHQRQVKSLEEMTNNLLTKAKTDPNEGFDFLAELVGQDPVQFKMDMIRAQIKEILPLAQMSEEERETWLKDRERDFRDKRYERRDQAEKEKAHSAKKAQELQVVREKFGMSEEDYAAGEKFCKDYLEKTGQKADIAPGDVVYANRYLMALDTANEAVPHLASRADFDRILEDITSDLVKSPALTREKLTKLLVEVWGTDDEKAGLKRLSKKAKDRAESEGSELPTAKPASRKEIVFFDDI